MSFEGLKGTLHEVALIEQTKPITTLTGHQCIFPV